MDADETQEEQIAWPLAGDAHGSDVESDADSSSDDDDTSTSSVETVLECRPQRQTVTDATAAFAQEVEAARNAAFGPELLQTLLAARAVPAWRERYYLDEIPQSLSDFYMNTQEENDKLLCNAAEFGDALCCFVLIESGANVNCVCDYGFSPLDHALLTSYPPRPDVVAKLLAAGADFSAHDLISAVKTQNVKVVQLLLQAGALVNKFRLRDGSAALQFANRPNVVKVLFRGRVAVEVRIERREGWNEAACAMMDQIRRAGGWKEYARQHKRVLAGLVAKCAPLPDEAARIIVEFWCPEGGY